MEKIQLMKKCSGALLSAALFAVALFGAAMPALAADGGESCESAADAATLTVDSADSEDGSAELASASYDVYESSGLKYVIGDFIVNGVPHSGSVEDYIAEAETGYTDEDGDTWKTEYSGSPSSSGPLVYQTSYTTTGASGGAAGSSGGSATFVMAGYGAYVIGRADSSSAKSITIPKQLDGVNVVGVYWRGMAANGGDALDSFDVSACTSLKALYLADPVDYSSLSVGSINFGSLSSLDSVYLGVESSEKVDLNGSKNLRSLELCDYYAGISFHGDNLEYLALFHTGFASFKMSNAVNLKQAHIEAGEYFNSLTLKNANALESLTVKSCALTSLDVSGFPALKTLDCSYNYIQDLGALEEWAAQDGHTATLTPQNSITFTDVKAGDTANHGDDVLWLAAQGISTGFFNADNATFEFRGLKSVARCDMAAFLYRLAGSPSYTPSAAVKSKFSDVKSSTDHAKEIWWLAEQGITAGFGDGTFRPYDTVARQDMAAFLHRLANRLGKQGSGTASLTFSDVRSGDEANHASDVLWLARNGISTGWKVGSRYEFRGRLAVTRQDMAAFLHRLSTNVLE